MECVHISVLNDLCLENSEVFSVSISSNADCVTISDLANSVDITITDDDGQWYITMLRVRVGTEP